MRDAADAQMRHESFMADVAAERDEHRANMTEIAILRDRVALLRRAVDDAKAQGWEHMSIASLEVYLGVAGERGAA
jgi:hypothetical protein